MKKQKLYFCIEIEEERCYTIEYFIEEMKDRNISSIELSEAVREVKSDYYFCKAVGECGIKPPEGEPCGKNCDSYKPRNGKKGCCINRGYVYGLGREYILTIDGNLIEKQ